MGGPDNQIEINQKTHTHYNKNLDYKFLDQSKYTIPVIKEVATIALITILND